jgi:hypothetical protein
MVRDKSRGLMAIVKRNWALKDRGFFRQGVVIGQLKSRITTLVLK